MKLDLVNSFLSWRMKKRYHQLELFMKYPHEVQAEVLAQLLDTAKDTEWGQRYDFESIDSFETFQERLPLNYCWRCQIHLLVNRLLRGI